MAPLWAFQQNTHKNTNKAHHSFICFTWSFSPDQVFKCLLLLSNVKITWKSVAIKYLHLADGTIFTDNAYRDFRHV